MKLFTTSAIALAAVLPATAGSAQMGYGSSTPTPPPTVPQMSGKDSQAQPSQAGGLKISKEATKAIVELQNAVNANDFASVPGKVAAAQAVAKTNQDRYAIAQLQLKAAVTAKDDAASASAIDAIAASQYLDAAKVASLYRAVGANFYNSKKFDLAAGAFQKASSLEPQSVEPLKLLAEARNAQGQKAEGAALLQKVLQMSAASGQKPVEDLYRRAVSMAYDAKSPSAVELGRQWVTAYPSPDSWRNSIAIFRNMYKPQVEGTLDLLRLMNAAGALTNPNDFNLYAASAADQGNYTEAQAIVDQGLASKAIDPSETRFKELIAALKTKPMATAADLEGAAKIAPAGSTLIKIGDRYYAMGKYSNAVELYRKALAKPGTDANLANLHIGMGLARSGDKAGAESALKSVSGEYSEIAKFWLLYVQHTA
jgi:tetratricopeptide (TPR) repeat protein